MRLIIDVYEIFSYILQTIQLSFSYRDANGLCCESIYRLNCR